MPLRLLVATALAFTVSVTPAAARTLEPLKPCYASTGPDTLQLEDIDVRGDSFAPLATVEVLVDGVVVANAPTNFVGDFRVWVDAPYQPRGERAFTLEARDAAGSVVTQSRVTNLAVFVRPRQAHPSSRVRFRGRGFMQAAPIYAHYLYNDREQKTARLARRSTGPCGTFSAKRRQIPIDDPQTGRWIVQIDQNRAYRSEPDPVWVRLPIRVSEVFRAPQATAAASAGTRLKTSSPAAASTSIRSPAENSPFRRPSASGSTSRLEITRLSGRAP
jgi:hypothetical protein